jgi:tetratricopeptide (TPR) repeat protein
MQNQAIKLEVSKADAVKQFMLDSFSVTDPNVAQGVDLSTKDLLRIAADKMTLDDDMDPAIKFELYMSLALANGRLGYYPEAIKLLDNALTIKPQNEQATALLAQYLFNAGEIETVNTLLSETPENDFNSSTEVAAIKRVRANILAQAGEYDAAFEQFESLKNLVASDMDTMKNQALLAEIYYLKGESERSVDILQQLKLSHPLPATDVFTLGLNSDLVQYHDRAGNFNAAMALTQENIQAYRQILGDEHPNLGLAYNSLSAFQRLEGQLDDALVSAKISEQIYRKRYGDSSEGLAQALSNIGVAYYYQKKFEPAIEQLTLAAEMLAVIFGESHPETMYAKGNLAVILNATGHPEKALPIIQNMYQYELETLGKGHRSTLLSQRSLALTLGNLGQFEAAIRHAQEVIELLSEYPNDQAYQISNAYSVLGRIYFMAGEHQLAIEQNLLHIKNNTEGNANNYARSLQLIGESHQALLQFDQAVEYYQMWTNHLAKTYGETDEKYLDGLLVTTEKLQQMKRQEQSKMLLLKVQNILIENDLNLKEIQAKLDALSGQ